MKNIYAKVFVNSKKCRIFAPAIENKDIEIIPVQWPIRLSVRTSDFHSGKRGSIPLWATKKNNRLKKRLRWQIINHPLKEFVRLKNGN